MYSPIEKVKSYQDINIEETVRLSFFYSAANAYRYANLDTDLDSIRKAVDKISYDEILDFVFGSKFYTKEKTGNYLFDIINKEMLEHNYLYEIEFADMNDKSKAIKKENPTDADHRNGIVNFEVFNKWQYYKQVYKIDKDFALALSHTEEILLSKEKLNHLPFNNFYIDLSDINHDEFHGAFVYIRKIYIKDDDYEISISVYFLNNDSHHWDGLYYIFSNDNDHIKMISDKKASVDNLSYKDLQYIVLQIIAYLSSEKPDIKENEITKKTYKPRKEGIPPKNKWSEVQMFDIGYTYGNKFRKAIKEYHLKENDIEFISSKRKHKPHRPYIKCAHWQRFRYGPGHSKLSEPVWMEPIFVGFGGNKKATNATIHEVE